MVIKEKERREREKRGREGGREGRRRSIYAHERAIMFTMVRVGAHLLPIFIDSETSEEKNVLSKK